MTITLNLSPETEQKLRERAAATGRDVVELAQDLIERGVRGQPTLDEILAPFREQVEKSGLTDEEFAKFFEEMRDEVWREKHEGRR
jgi:hypothetical protein